MFKFNSEKNFDLNTSENDRNKSPLLAEFIELTGFDELNEKMLTAT